MSTSLYGGGKKVLVVGLTGGIGVGKSTIAQFLRKRGAIVIDADEVAKEIVSPRGEIWGELVNCFGEEILRKDKAINRKRLGNIVFSDPKKLKVLDSLTHPPIVQVIEDKLKQIEKTASSEQVVVVDAPLLAEAGLLPYVQFVVVVAAKHKIRLERLEKNGFSHDEALARIRAQTPDNKRFEFADHIMRNEGTKKELQEKVDQLWSCLIQVTKKEADS